MKKFTFFKTLALFAGLLFLASSGRGQTYLIQEGFITTSFPSGWSGDVYFNTTANIGNLTGANGAGFNANNKYLQTPSVNSPGVLTFWMKGSAASSQISLKVQKSVGGGSFEDIETFPKPHTTTAAQYTVIVNEASSNVVLKFVAYDRTGNSLYIDDIELTEYSASTPTLIVAPTTLSDFTYEVGSGPSSEQSFTVSGLNLTEDITVSAPTNYEISQNSGGTFSSSISLTLTAGAVAETKIYVRLKEGLAIGTNYDETISLTSSGATEQTVTLCGEVTAPPPPTITVNPDAISGFTYVEGQGPSGEKNATVSGSNLTANITIEAPANYEISQTSGNGYTTSINLTQTGGTVNETIIYARLKAELPIATYNESIQITSTDADPKTVALNGSVLDPNLNVEDFSNSNATAAYAENSFVGNNGITWTYVASRDGNNDANSSGIDLPALMLRRVSDNSAVYSNTISGGMGNFSVKLYKGFTGGGNRQVELFINGVSKGTSTPFDDFNEHIFEVTDINVPGDIIIKIANTTEYQVIVDDISWTGYETESPFITVTPVNLSGFTYLLGNGPSATQSFEVSGNSLNGNDATITAPSNFEVSLNETSGFGATVTLTAFDGTATIVWVRLASGLSVNTYSGNVLVAGGGAPEVNVAVSGEVTIPIPEGYLVDFEGAGETKIAYASGTVNLSGLDWDMTEALIGTDASDWKNGVRSARLRGYGTSSMTMLANKTTGVGVVSFLYRRYGTDAQGDWKVEYSTDGGTTWTQIGSSFTAPTTDVVQTFSEVLNLEGNVRIRIKRATESGTANQRLNIDDILLTDYSGGEPAQEPTAHVTGFSATANSHSTITVSWMDSDADFYLIKGSDEGFASIAAPVDGTPEPDGSLVKNVAAGEGTYQFSGLTPSTTYYFKIYPYNGTGSTINYKTDGNVPEAEAGTNANPITDYFRTKQSGLWHSTDTWEQSSDGAVWIDALIIPTYESNNIGILVGHNVTVDQTLQVDQLGIHGTLVIEGTGVTFTLGNGEGLDEDGADLIVYANGLLRMAVTGSTGGWAFQSGATWKVKDGGTYTHNSTRGIATPLNNLTLEAGSTFKYVGDNSVTPAMALSGRTYYNLFFESAEGSWTSSPAGSNPLTINGNLTIEENVTLNFGSFTGDLSVGGNFSNSGNVTFGRNVTVTGPLTNIAGADGLVIKDGGSLIHNTTGVDATMERFIPAANWADGTDGWHFLSSPVSEQAINEAWAPNAVNDDSDFYAWLETSPGTWVNFKNTTETPTFENTNLGLNFIPGKGYLVAYQLTATRLFAGTLNTGDVAFVLKNSDPGTGTKEWTYNSGWNLLGNPYPSAIDWRLANKTQFQDVFAYIYDTNKDGGAGYVTVDGIETSTNYFVPANQGFFALAKVEANDQPYTFSNSWRTHGGTFLKDQEFPDNLIIRLSQGNYFDKTTLRILNESEMSRDRTDALKLFSFSADVPQLFSQTSDQVQVAINSVPQINEDTEFTLGLRAPASGQYTLSVSELSGIFQSNALYLKDLQTGAVHNLQQSPEYAFQATQGDDPARFIITFAQPTGITDLEGGLASIYTWNRKLYLNFAEEAEGRLLQVFDLSGRLVMSDGLDHGLNHTRPMNLEAGVYLVRISSPKGVSTQRVFVK